jgi:hypothetical protein
MTGLVYGSPALLAVVVGIYIAYRGVEIVLRRSLETTDEPRVSRAVAALSAVFALYLLCRGSVEGAPSSIIAGALLLLAAGDVLFRQRRRSAADRDRIADIHRG